MSAFSLAFRGAGVLLATQLMIGLGQFLYSGATARIFTPTQFGSFTGILGLQGLLILVTTTGLPSLVLHRKQLSTRDVAWIRLYAVLGGAFAAAVFYFLVPLWADLLRALEVQEFRALLTLSLTIFPIASVESALLRREGRSRADALCILLSFVLPAAVAITIGLSTRQPWALALVPVLNPAVLGLLSSLARRQKHEGGAATPHREFATFAWNVSRQNVVFFVMAQAPAWTLSASVGARSLGSFNRASSLALSIGTPLTTALNRASQAHWRKLIGDNSGATLAMRDATVLASSLSFPLFAILVALGPKLTAVWLGPGWTEVGALIPGLAVAAAVQVPFSLLAASLEMRGLFRKVRLGQLGLGLGAVITISALLITHSAVLASVGVAVTQVLGLFALLLTIADGDGREFLALSSSTLVPASWALLIGAAAFIGAMSFEYVPMEILGSREITQCLIGASTGFIVWLLTLRWQEVTHLLTRRGIQLPRFLRRD